MIGKRKNAAVIANPSTRRGVIFGTVMAFGGLGAGSKVFGRGQAVEETPSKAANKTRTFLHQEIDFKASPRRIYEVLLDSKQFAAFTVMPAEIDPKPGGAFSLFGGLVAGRNIELIPAQRIVQAWRPTHWDAGIYSIVRFELKPRDSETTVVLDHTGFPEGAFDTLNSGWKPRYWDPLKKFFA